MHSNPSNPVIGPRAFGCSPEAVVRFAIPFALRLLDEGVLCCAKHFPGHGDTATDSHYGLPVINKSLEELEACELIPFTAAAKARIPLFMTAHILFPKVDASYPATMSKRLLDGVLRKKLGFEGTVISDDLSMKAVYELFQSKEAVVCALEAGCDMFCASRFKDPDSTLPILLAEQLLKADSAPTFAARRRKSIFRIESLLNRVSMYEPTLLKQYQR